MNQTIRRGDYLEVDYVEPPPVVDEKKKKANEQPNANIYSEVISPAECLDRFRIPFKVSPTDGYAVSNIRDKLIQLKSETENNPQNQGTLREINQLFLELKNLETLEKVEVSTKPFAQSQKQENKLPPPKDYTLVLPFSTEIEERVKKLESLEYPQLMLSELMISILLGEKQQTFDSSRNMDKKNDNSVITKNEDLISLSNRFDKIEGTISGFPSLIEKINKDQSVHTNSIGFIDNLQRVSNTHHQIQEELNDNIALAQKLRENWGENKKVLKETIAALKERLGKLKKK